MDFTWRVLSSSLRVTYNRPIQFQEILIQWTLLLTQNVHAISFRQRRKMATNADYT